MCHVIALKEVGILTIFPLQKRGKYVPIRFAFSSLKMKFCSKNILYPFVIGLSKTEVILVIDNVVDNLSKRKASKLAGFYIPHYLNTKQLAVML